jgi:hypothetical protein
MKEYDHRKDYVQEFWKLGISSQIGMLDAMTNALDSFPKEMQGSCLREMYKSNAAFITMYFRTIEQMGDQTVEMQFDAFRRSSDVLKAVLSKMARTGMPVEPEAKPS